MASGDKRWIAVLGVAALCGAVAVFFFRRDDAAKPQRAGELEGDDAQKRWRGFAAGQPSLPGSDGGFPDDGSARPPPASDPPVERQIENVMGMWRHAIINKDADAVLSADRIFATERQKFMNALVTSAETDSEDRVRAFSTRVLGKYRSPECADVFGRLLKDKSQHVRGNAAWGLGELMGQPGGREAAHKALGTLRLIAKQDPSAEARSAAAIAVTKLK